MSYACPLVEYETKENYNEMIYNVIRFKLVRAKKEEKPNKEAQKFYDILKETQQTLWKGCI